MLQFLTEQIERLGAAPPPDNTHAKVYSSIQDFMKTKADSATHIHVFCEGQKELKQLLGIQCAFMSDIFGGRVLLSCDFPSKVSSDAEFARSLGFPVRKYKSCDVFIALGSAPPTEVKCALFMAADKNLTPPNATFVSIK